MLALAGNCIYGTIPEEIGQLDHLLALELHENGLVSVSHRNSCLILLCIVFLIIFFCNLLEWGHAVNDIPIEKAATA